MNNYQIKISNDPNDIKDVMHVIKSFGADNHSLKKIKIHVEDELKELGRGRELIVLSTESEPVAVVQLVKSNADNDPDLANGVDVAHIHSLQVSKNHHRKGYGTTLMDELERYSKGIGISTLTLGVDEDNLKARGLYEKIGYKLMKEEEGRTPVFKLFYLYKTL